MPTPIRYARSGDFELAYQVTGRGLLDIVLVPGFVSHLELDWEYPGAARMFERLGAFARLIRFDPRGIGLSVRTQPDSGLQARLEDVLAVMDAAASTKAALLAYAEGGHLAIRLAVEHPERVTGLVLVGASARTVRTADYPWGETWPERIERAGRTERSWGAGDDVDTVAPGADDELRRWYAARARAASSPSTARALLLASGQIDVRAELPAVDAPTLVLHRRGDRIVSLEEERYLAEHIPGARLVELEGDAHLPYVDPDPIADEVEAFLTGVRREQPVVAAGEPGSMLAGYRIDALAGRGGMGAVYVAHDDRLGRRVALKVIAPELAGDERFRERFLLEWRIAAALEHPNVIPVHAAGEAEGRLYLAMRYVEGADLRSLLAEAATLEPARALGIAAQIASALDAAHAHGLVHRDVKPGNILIDAGGHAYLCDFGLTKDLAAATGVTATGQLVGTLAYVAPEQIRADTVDGRADQYALACVLYECLTGAPPFRRGSEAQVLWAHMQERPAPLPGIPELDPVLARGLAKSPEERYESCAAFVTAAQQALGLAPAQITARRRLRVGRRLVLIGALLLLIALIAIAFELSRQSNGAPRSPEPASVSSAVRPALRLS
jgi:pimeloyl-ACP methyl ester carboxylesterase